MGEGRIPSASTSILNVIRLTHRFTPTASQRTSLDQVTLRRATLANSPTCTIRPSTLGTTTTGVDPVMVIHETPPTMFLLDQPSIVVVVLPPLLPKVVTPLRLPQSHRLQLLPTTRRPMLPLLPMEVMLLRLPAPTPPRRPVPMKSLRQLQLLTSHHRKSFF
jgi:hypothetical protein